MINNQSKDTTFAPEDPQLAIYSRLNFKALFILYGVTAFLYLLATSILLISGEFQLNSALRVTTLVIIFLLNFLILLYSSYLPSRYWRGLQQKRQLAFEQPESYLFSSQPAAISELPQPGRVATMTKASAILLLILPYIFILLTVMCLLFFNTSLSMVLQIGIAVALLLSIAVLVTVYVQRNRPKWPYVEVSERGIAAAMDKIKQPMPWQDICFFATYKGPSTPLLLSTSKHDRYYELASPQKIIRWRYQPKRSPQIKIQPKMDQQAYDRWHQQLLGYIRERTNLPLIDLDSVPAQAGKK